ncbi:NAD-dependent epimerase/dehydratase family protein [Pseudomonas veronii]|uniref:NAD-dependent epimerase/dehydratase family protein n=1 Tax=Pseudomonas veronii TaxID=76761 RepID=A0ABS0V7Z5_PSEVE|nr:NAD-dependent epimerase/dehydratase family protein [Pseudomonas veronii]MBI6556891.1 NAD-dependent epimerase/dehydratase family protein [Pseudomonas veronii]MBI6647614.1 NAD-dependent epimerase/dehydratase family protein [Pseudomonas veronii]
MTAPSRVLVTGAGGFTGRALCTSLQAREYDVYGLSQKQSSDADTSSCSIVVGNLLDRESLAQALQEIRPLQVVHRAARAFVGSDDSAVFYLTNVTDTCNQLDGARANSLERVVVASNASVYGVPHDARPWGESFVPMPVDHDAASSW